MTAKDGRPCKKCGTSVWDKWGHCVTCNRESTRRWDAANPDKHAARARRWVIGNREKCADGSRRWYEANPEKASDKTRRWNEANPDKARAKWNRHRTRKSQAGGSYTASEFKALCDHYGNKCLRCGRNDVKLTFDHVVPVCKGGTSDISNGQPLCKSCNSAKKDKHIDYRPDAGPLRWLQAKLFG